MRTWGSEVTAETHEHTGTAEAQPIPISGDVTIGHAVRTHSAPADFGAYFSVVLAGTEKPLQLLPYDVNRKIAYVTLTGTGPVYVGASSGVTAMAGGATTGQAPAFILSAGLTLTVTHKQAVYLAPDGTHSATVSVAVERWEP